MQSHLTTFMQRTDAKPISALIQAFVRENHLEEGLIRSHVFDAWDAVVAETTAGACSPAKAAALTSRKFFKDGVLSVKINSSIVRMQFQMNASSLLKRLNEKLDGPVVTKIIFS